MDEPTHDWYLKEWAALSGKRQVDFVKDLGWNKSRVNFLFNGKQPYNRDILNDIAAYLDILPHELLLHPEDAIALRRMRRSAKEIAGVSLVAEDSPGWMEAPPRRDLTGTGR